MARGTASQRTLELLREWKWYYWTVERFIPYSNTRSDLFNIIDYLVITDHSTIGIQSCGTGFSDHVNKLAVQEVDQTIAWLKCKNRKLILIGWRKLLIRRGMKQRVWRARVAWFYLDNGKLIVEEKDTSNG